jgi:hypothetical protein
MCAEDRDPRALRGEIDDGPVGALTVGAVAGPYRAVARAAPERAALWVIRLAGTAALVLGLTLLAVLPAKPAVENVPGFRTAVVGFELASRPAEVAGILGAPGTPEWARTVRRMKLGTWIDFFFALTYSGFYVGIALLLDARVRPPWPLLRTVAVLAAAMALADILENTELLRLCRSVDAASMSGPLARLRAFTLTKWYAIYTASGLLTPVLWRAGKPWRWAAPPFAGAAALGALSLIHLPAIEHGSLLLFVAWMVSWGCSFERRLRDPRA